MKELLCCLISATAYALLPWVAQSAGIAARAGWIGGLAGAALPLFFWIETKGTWEAPLASLLLLVALAWTLRWPKREIPDLGYGAFWGITFYFAPQFLVVFLSWMAWLLWHSTDRAVFLRRAAWVALGCVAVVTPWTVRNVLVFDRLFWFRDNVALEFYISNVPESSADFAINLENGLFSRYHPFLNHDERVALMKVGEVAYFDQLGRKTNALIRANPGRFASLTAQRFVLFWFTRTNHPVKTALSAFIVLLGLAGLFLLRHEPQVLSVFGLLFFVFPLVYYFVQQDPRYRFPLHWPLCLLAGESLRRLSERFRQSAAGQGAVRYPG